MTGFKNFILRGNLVELAVAFIMGAAFATVVTATVRVIMDLIGKVGHQDKFSNYQPGGVHVGAWLTAVISFANFTTRANVALGIESDGFAAACGLAPLAQPTTQRTTVGS